MVSEMSTQTERIRDSPKTRTQMEWTAQLSNFQDFKLRRRKMRRTVGRHIGWVETVLCYTSARSLLFKK